MRGEALDVVYLVNVRHMVLDVVYAVNVRRGVCSEC